MDKKEARALKRQEKKAEKRQQKYTNVAEGSKFKKWRNQRPFWGATLTLLAGLLILYIPMHLYAIAFIPGNLVFVGFFFGGMTLIIGILSYFYSQFSTVFGIITIFLSVLSVMGALGGFIIGTILGIIGGSLLIGWEKEEVTLNNDNRSKKKLEESQQQVVQEETASTAQS